MPHPLPSEDIRPLSEFRAHAASFVQAVRTSGRPLILTQHGRGAAVLLDVRAYEALVEQVELLQDVHRAEQQIAAGEGVAHADAREAILARARR
jgi:prevent-host-death family protein